jgi:hypothetical protein
MAFALLMSVVPMGIKTMPMMMNTAMTILGVMIGCHAGILCW